MPTCCCGMSRTEGVACGENFIVNHRLNPSNLERFRLCSVVISLRNSEQVGNEGVGFVEREDTINAKQPSSLNPVIHYIYGVKHASDTATLTTAMISTVRNISTFDDNWDSPIVHCCYRQPPQGAARERVQCHQKSITRLFRHDESIHSCMHFCG